VMCGWTFALLELLVSWTLKAWVDTTRLRQAGDSNGMQYDANDIFYRHSVLCKCCKKVVRQGRFVTSWWKIRQVQRFG